MIATCPHRQNQISIFHRILNLLLHPFPRYILTPLVITFTKEIYTRYNTKETSVSHFRFFLIGKRGELKEVRNGVPLEKI